MRHPVVQLLAALAVGTYIIRFARRTYIWPEAMRQRRFLWMADRPWASSFLRGMAVFWVFGGFMIISQGVTGLPFLSHYRGTTPLIVVTALAVVATVLVISTTPSEPPEPPWKGRPMFGFKPGRRNDPVFGSMLYMRGLEYWEGKARFAPTGAEIEVFVDGSADDNMSRQHRFYETVCQRWSELAAQITAQLRLDGPADAEHELRVSSMSIPESEFRDDAEWEVSFSSQSVVDLYTVQMKGVTPISVVRDD